MKRLLAIITILFVATALVHADGVYEITWSSIDCGGYEIGGGGSYTLTGSIGQPDGGPAVAPPSGGYSMTGGFWPAAVCGCVSDMNLDRERDGADIQAFVDCYLHRVGDNCGCADMDRNGVLDTTDLSMFVTGLLIGGSCP